MKKTILIFSILISQASFSQTAPDFKVSSIGYFCHQEPEEAYQQALSMLQVNANNICKNSRAILVTKIEEKNDYCSVKLTAGYICEHRSIYCKPKGYVLKCCDRISNTCWIE